VRVLRFGLTSLINSKTVGVGAGAVDSFLVDKLFSGYQPRVLFDRLSRLFGV
jgi:hypothetical protein